MRLTMKRLQLTTHEPRPSSPPDLWPSGRGSSRRSQIRWQWWPGFEATSTQEFSVHTSRLSQFSQVRSYKSFDPSESENFHWKWHTTGTETVIVLQLAFLFLIIRLNVLLFDSHPSQCRQSAVENRTVSVKPNLSIIICLLFRRLCPVAEVYSFRSPGGDFGLRLSSPSIHSPHIAFRHSLNLQHRSDTPAWHLGILLRGEWTLRQNFEQALIDLCS